MTAMFRWVSAWVTSRQAWSRQRGREWAESTIETRGLDGMLADFDASRAMGLVDEHFDEGVLDVIKDNTPT